MHSLKISYCHFFNNGKVCQFEKLGCKFKHEVSPNCRYGQQCKKELCGFRHYSREESIHQELTVSEENIMEQAMSIFCENYCELKKNIHVHTKQANDHYLVVNIKEMDKTKFPCLLCGF